MGLKISKKEDGAMATRLIMCTPHIEYYARDCLRLVSESGGVRLAKFSREEKMHFGIFLCKMFTLGWYSSYEWKIETTEAELTAGPKTTRVLNKLYDKCLYEYRYSALLQQKKQIFNVLKISIEDKGG